MEHFIKTKALPEKDGLKPYMPIDFGYTRLPYTQP